MSAPDFDLAALLRRMGLIGEDESFTYAPLSGGISCDVWRISRQDGKRLVLKRALPKLRVAVDWRAPAERSHTEVEWLRLVAKIDPKLVPQVLGENRLAHAFAMEFLPPDAFALWKAELAAGRADPRFAAGTGSALARIHAATAAKSEIAAQFTNQAQFFALRLEPYLIYAAGQHPDVAPAIRALAQSIVRSRVALMQGDVSPKNILCGPDGPVFLDAETACYGDPAFDLAFCLNHLMLKCIWHREFAGAYLASFEALVQAYLREVAWENPEGTEARTAALLPALLLARIDGKSPVEYIAREEDKAFVRRFAKRHLIEPLPSVSALRDAWAAALYST